MTTGSKLAPFRLPITFDGKNGLILLDRIRAVDKRRLLNRVGAVRSNTLARALAGLQAVFAD